MKVYVACSIRKRNTAKNLMELVKTWGHEITYDWTKHELSSDHEVRLDYAVKDVKGVIDCEAFVLVADELRTAGKYTEFGIALASSKAIGEGTKELILFDLSLFDATRDISVFFEYDSIYVVNNIYELQQTLKQLEDNRSDTNDS